MTVKERIEEAGYEDVIILDNFSYDDALIGISEDNRAVYSYELMIEWLINNENMTETEAAEWIDYNTLRALPYFGPQAPIIIHEI